MTPLETTEAILAALQPDQTPDHWSSRWQLAALDWDDLTLRAIVFGLGPQLHHRLTIWQLEPPSRAAAKLRLNEQAHARRNEAIRHQLIEVLAACTARDLHPILLKGAHLAFHLYPAPSLRPMNDIDLLFPAEELPAVESLLADLAYGGKHRSPAVGPGVTKHTSTFRRASARTEANRATPNPYLSTTGDRTVEPHTSLEESWFGLKVDITPGIRSRSTTIRFGDQGAQVLAQEDLLLHLCVHLCFHLIQGAPALVQLADLLAVTTATETDWATVVERARRHRAAPFALAALHLAQKLLRAPVPDAALTELAAATPAPLRRTVASMDLAYILRRTQQEPLHSLPSRLQRGILDRAETARWAPDLRTRWQVWQTALQPARTDTGQLLLKAIRKP